MNIFIGCSSRNEIAKEYLDLAQKVGKELSHHHLIIGGTMNGMMGSVCKDVEDEHITQIVLKDYVDEEDQEKGNFIICDTSFERMKLIWDASDIFLFLPGGTGTLGEIITFLEENRPKKEKKKILVYNYQNFYQDILCYMEKIKKLQFSNQDILEGLCFIDNIEELKERIEEAL